MASFRTLATLTLLAGACILGASTTASAQSARLAAAPTSQAGFARCPSAGEYVDVMRQLIGSAARARALADENPLLEPDAAFYEAELAATRKCAPAVAVLTR